MSDVEDRIAILQTELKNEKQKIREERSHKDFQCMCGKLHKIRDCVIIQTHWYTSPSGCYSGDYWTQGELQIICPDTDNKNRLLYDSKYNVPYEKGCEFKYSAELQFSSMYKGLFKEVINDYEKDNRRWWNNYTIDRNHEYYGIKIGGIDV